MKKHRLQLVSDGDRLEGKSPIDFERVARTAKVGSADHRGLLHIAATLTNRCVAITVPPSAQAELSSGLNIARLWIQGKASDIQVREARAQTFQALVAIEKLTAVAVKKASQHLDSQAGTALDHHAEHVVERYARLGAHFSTSAVCHLLDATLDPKLSSEVLQDIEGARAYQSTGLGAVRHPAFRKAAWDQATWESSRPGQEDKGTEAVSAIALQVFHEYLGGRWRNQADEVRSQNQRFIAWALSGRMN